MSNKNSINEKWLKSSIIGTLWASSEIVLGSFLHNLKVPFAGSLLTMIGVTILISASYVWKEKGIFWRAGLICALMKTISPSAVIFGPMIAIFAEALLLEISVRMLGKNYLGFFIGSILASSWSFFQKAVNFLIFYGFNIIELYKNLVIYAEKQLDIKFKTVWLPILVLLSVYVLIGILTSIIGIKTGKNIVSKPITYEHKSYDNQMFLNPKSFSNKFQYSIFWLLFNCLLMIGSILLISLTNWKIWTIVSIAVVIVWILRYKRALRQLLKPKFWIFFIVITMLTALVFTKLQYRSITDAILFGIEMNFRATIMILGFSVLGTELYNPTIRNFFIRTNLKQLPLALELSIESLPQVIANIPDSKTIFKNPTSVVSQLIAYSEMRFKELRKANFQQHIFIISGLKNSGKTALLKKVIDILKHNNIKIVGFFSAKLYENELLTGYNIVNVLDNESKNFLQLKDKNSNEIIGNFCIVKQGLEFGNEILKPENIADKQLVVIDEIGNLELSGKGWSARITELINSQQNHLLIVIRECFVEKVIQQWNILNYTILKNHENDEYKISNVIISKMV